MRILQLVPIFGSIGGIEHYVDRLSNTLVARGHTTTVATSRLSSTVLSPYSVVHCPGFANPVPRNEQSAEDRVLALATDFRPDVILSHSIRNARLLARLHLRYPTVEFVHTFLCAGGKLFRRGDRVCTHPITVRCLTDWYVHRCGCHRSPVVALREHMRAVNYAAVLKQLDAIIVGSGYMRQYLIQEGVPEDRLFITDLTLGILPESKARPVAGPRVNILFVGQLVRNKGVQYALRALTLLEESYCLTVVGDGYYRRTLQQLAVRLGVEHRVEFTGYLQGDALEARYRDAAVAVVPSVIPEPAGLVVPEARAHGIPVVAFSVGGLTEWAGRLDQIYLAEHANVASLGQEIAKAAEGDLPARPCASADALHSLESILERALSRASQSRVMDPTRTGWVARASGSSQPRPVHEEPLPRR
jgi:glycosyltransferase involved in cell wall biosynthesis